MYLDDKETCLNYDFTTSTETDPEKSLDRG